MGGGGRFSPTDWDTYAKTTTGKSTKAIYKSTGLKPSLDPKGIKLRESRDSKINPSSTALIVGVDVTGSMGIIADHIARTGLGVLFKEVYERKPISDPHVMFMAIGDATCDEAPLQVSQFESEAKVIIPQLVDIYVEGHGGNNNSESYHLPWYFAATKTSIDCFEKRGKKGYLFTIGDEVTPPPLTKVQLREVLGDDVHQPVSAAEAYKMASRTYHVFHIIVDQGSFASNAPRQVDKAWKELMGQHAIHLNDYEKLSEVIVSAIQVVEGEDTDDVVKSWKGATAITVRSAIKDLVPSKGGGKKEVIRL